MGQGLMLLISLRKISAEIAVMDELREKDCAENFFLAVIDEARYDLNHLLYQYDLAYLIVFAVSCIVDLLVLMRICKKRNKQRNYRVEEAAQLAEPLDEPLM